MKAAALALVLFGGIACGSADADSDTGDRELRARPVLTIVSVDPLVVRGKQFVPGERVKLLVGSPAPRMKAVRADALGRFTVRFELEVASCESVVVQAFGSRGSRAMADRPVLGCIPYGLPGERP